MNAIAVNTKLGTEIFYLFKIHSMTACERRQGVKADFTARLEYVGNCEAEKAETPRGLIGITQLEEGSLLDVYVLEKVEAIVKEAFCNKQSILAWVKKDQGANVTTIEGVIQLPEPTEAEHVNYYQEMYRKACNKSDM